MNTIGALQFKEQCLELLDNLDDEGLVVTKHGWPVARVLPYRDVDGDLIGSLRDKTRIRGDVLTTGVGWRADDRS